MDSAARRHLVVFARVPRRGAGKSRLARDSGAGEAVRFQRVRLELCLRTLADERRWTLWAALTPPHVHPLPRTVRPLTQGGGDLGARMGRVMRALPPGPAVLIGSDTPGICKTEIATAFNALGAADAVFGPARDGGYWLVGLRRRPRLLLPFTGVRWSTPHALSDTLAALAPATHALLAPRADIDTGADLKSCPDWARLITQT